MWGAGYRGACGSLVFLEGGSVVKGVVSFGVVGGLSVTNTLSLPYEINFNESGGEW